jgi:acetoacetate decarboxylase
MRGQLWLSLFRVTEDVDERRPAGVYGAAFVSYEPGSELTYSELLVARPVDADATGGRGRRVSVVDIWVDSPASRDGGRSLWGIPKELCDFTLDSAHRGPASRTEWSAAAARRPIARATFTDVSKAALRTPFRGGTWQPPLEPGGEERTATLRGSAKTLPCRGQWEFDPAGPLGWLAGRRRLASFRMTDFRMTFG